MRIVSKWSNGFKGASAIMPEAHAHCREHWYRRQIEGLRPDLSACRLSEIDEIAIETQNGLSKALVEAKIKLLFSALVRYSCGVKRMGLPNLRLAASSQTGVIHRE